MDNSPLVVVYVPGIDGLDRAAKSHVTQLLRISDSHVVRVVTVDLDPELGEEDRALVAERTLSGISVPVVLVAHSAGAETVIALLSGLVTLRIRKALFMAPDVVDFRCAKLALEGIPAESLFGSFDTLVSLETAYCWHRIGKSRIVPDSHALTGAEALEWLTNRVTELL